MRMGRAPRGPHAGHDARLATGSEGALAPVPAAPSRADSCILGARSEQAGRWDETMARVGLPVEMDTGTTSANAADGRVPSADARGPMSAPAAS